MELFEQVTALVDNEIHDETKRKKIKDLIETDSELNYEYQVQTYLKKLIQSRVRFVEMPQRIRERIVRNILHEIPEQKPISEQKVKWFNIFKKPQYAFSALAIFLAAIVFILIPFSTSDDLAIKQSGDSNMFIQARQNFQNIINGNLSLQYLSNEPNEIKKYFRKQGVKYNTSVPKVNNWQLIGAVVSESNGEKFAHHLYKTREGKLVYLYQAEEKCLKDRKSIHLSDELISRLDKDNFYKYSHNNASMLIWKLKKNICILVSNDDINKIENEFISSLDY